MDCRNTKMAEREPPERFPDKPEARVEFMNQFKDPTISKEAKMAKARAIMASSTLPTLTQSEINELILNLGEMTWEETQVIARRWVRFKPNPPVKRWNPGMEDEFYSCPEKLPKARNGPGAELECRIYQLLAKPRLSPGIEKPEPWADSGPPDVIPDADYGDERLPKPVWSKLNIDNELFRSQWNREYKDQAKAYDDSEPAYPIVRDGELTLTTEVQESIYNPKPTPFEPDLILDPTEAWEDSNLRYRISSISIPNVVVRKQFFDWFDQLPDEPQVVNIFRAAFFDGTAVSDGVSEMFLPNLKHLPAPRSMKDELTSLHWHETSRGYTYNWSPTNQKRLKAEEERQEYLRRSAPHRAWLNLPPGSKVVPPNIYLRPAEHYDSSRVRKIMQWYTENSFASGDLSSMGETEYEKLLAFCRNAKLPFVVAAQRPEWKYHSNQIDRAVGFAYVKYHRPSNGADASMGELQVFVREENKKQHIGRALVHMVISCFETDPTAGKTGDYQFKGMGSVEYGPGYSESPTTLLCVVADHAGPNKEQGWVKDWLKKDFGFQEKSEFGGARIKFGKSYAPPGHPSDPNDSQDLSGSTSATWLTKSITPT
ncbi:unnamed protein product [Penicillium olsonii]|nr:unnamed protein product [Penicillium olsonii]CAG7922706.1 unnamed protein product [Penicillium olsonii]